MKARLDATGKLVPPSNAAEGRQRLAQLEIELPRIERQLADPKRQEAKYPTRAGYEAWRTLAQRAQRHLQREHEQLTEWLKAHPETDLLRQAHALLSEIRADGGLNPGEEEVVVAIDEHFARLDGSAGNTDNARQESK